MFKSINVLSLSAAILSISACNAQFKNNKTESFKVYGNCGMCESTIEKAGSLKKVANVDWNQETGVATLNYDSTKTNGEEILKRIALAGYDNEKFRAPDEVYNNLHGCCQYERVALKKTDNTKAEVSHDSQKHSNSKLHEVVVEKSIDEQNNLFDLYLNYFSVKDALVKTDVNEASKQAKNLLVAVSDVDMNTLPKEVHHVWMKVLKGVTESANGIISSLDASKQRSHFIVLSENVYQLVSITKSDSPIYYQHCPMANNGKGANWLSLDNNIKNPYFGQQMLSCGKTVETIK